MPSDVTAVLNLEVPIIVRLGERGMSFEEVVNLFPGAIIDLQRDADQDLDLLVNNVQIGQGAAVKVGENFGLRITFVGDLRAKIEAMSGKDLYGDSPSRGEKNDDGGEFTSDEEAARIAEEILNRNFR